MTSPANVPSLALDDVGSGVPVLLLHSSGLSGRQWRRLVPRLSGAGFRALVADLSGHGASPPIAEPTPFTLATDIDAVVALLAQHGPLHLVGHSYGALIGILAAIRAPQAVRSMVLFEPVAFGSLHPRADGDARASLDHLDFRWGPTAEDRERWLQTFVDYWSGTGAWMSMREEARSEFRRIGWAVEEGVRSLLDDRTPAAAYRVLGVPVRLISGETSPLAARRVVQRLGEVIPRATVVTVPDAGHMAPVTHADLVNGIILEALAAAR